MTHTAPIELIATTAPALPVPAGLAPVRGRARHRAGGIAAITTVSNTPTPPGTWLITPTIVAAA